MIGGTRSRNPYSRKSRLRTVRPLSSRFYVGPIALSFLNVSMLYLLLVGNILNDENPEDSSKPKIALEEEKETGVSVALEDDVSESPMTLVDAGHRIHRRHPTTGGGKSRLDVLMETILDEDFVIDKDRRKYGREICKFYDFAVTGFAKCATTAIHAWLDKHPDVRMAKGEMVHTNQNPLETARKIQYRILPNGPGEFRGYCNPHDIQWSGSLDFFVNSCPQTKLIVSVRHPVLWFESFYNYRIMNHHEWAIDGLPNELIKRSDEEREPEPYFVNSANGAFHKYLAVLGKTSLHDDEMELLRGWYMSMNEFRSGNSVVTNPIFLLESTQISDVHNEHFDQLNHDLSKFLGLSTGLPEHVPHTNRGRSGRAGMIDICDAQYRPIHDEMMMIAKKSAAWIQDYFVKSPDVTYSGNFLDILDGWNSDPCDAREKKQED